MRTKLMLDRYRMTSHVAAYKDPVEIPILGFLEPDEGTPMLPPAQPVRSGRPKGSKGKAKGVTVNGKEKGPQKRARIQSNGEFNHTARFDPPAAAAAGGGGGGAAAGGGGASATPAAAAGGSGGGGGASTAGSAAAATGGGGGSASAAAVAGAAATVAWAGAISGATVEAARPKAAVVNPYKTRGESKAAAGTKRKVPAYMEFA